MNQNLDNQKASPSQLDSRESVLVSPDSSLYEWQTPSRKRIGVNLSHVQQNLDGNLYRVDVGTAIRLQMPELDDKHFNARFESHFNGDGAFIEPASIGKFLTREFKRVFGEVERRAKVAEVKQQHEQEATDAAIRCWLTPDRIGRGLETGMASTSPILETMKPQELIEWMDDELNKIRTAASRSAIESARFILAQYISGRQQVYVGNAHGLRGEPNHDDEG
ncbi:hypothetical protein I6M44_14850 [Shewanella algae]|uniref:hypothetical protein n=1 Tax=Shewanella algae TaxID=38313 RepID=UPI001AAC5C57|nr:hypothetical protein [Shewanella algae]MBO2625327.1 hypothetical protein [Shewanella algae]